MLQFGEILSELREDKGLTQRELAAIFHISNSCISAYELGSRLPPVDMLVQFARFFDVTTDYLLGLASCSFPLSQLNEPIANGVTTSDAICMIHGLPQEYRDALILFLKAFHKGGAVK